MARERKLREGMIQSRRSPTVDPNATATAEEVALLKRAL